MAFSVCILTFAASKGVTTAQRRPPPKLPTTVAAQAWSTRAARPRFSSGIVKPKAKKPLMKYPTIIGSQPANRASSPSSRRFLWLRPRLVAADVWSFVFTSSSGVGPHGQRPYTPRHKPRARRTVSVTSSSLTDPTSGTKDVVHARLRGDFSKASTSGMTYLPLLRVGAKPAGSNLSKLSDRF